MGIAALVLGIISIVIGFVPFCGVIAFIPALVGLILGIVDIVKKNKEGQPKGMAIAGTVLSALALLFIIYWFFFAGMVGIAAVDEAVKSLNQVNSNYYPY